MSETIAEGEMKVSRNGWESRIYFTSDLHIGHAKAIEFTNRPFADVEEMDRKLIENINETVGVDDDLWILGDFVFRGGKDRVREVRDQIHCKNVHLVRGNHDRDYTRDGIFTSVNDYVELNTRFGKFMLFHYPILDWDSSHHGTIHLHGHIHSTGEYNAENMKRTLGSLFAYGHGKEGEIWEQPLRMYDVGVDANDYRPVSMMELAVKLSLTLAQGKNLKDV